MIGANNRDVIVVDVCGTLVRDDTTMGLIAYHLLKQPNKWVHRLIFAFTTARLSPFRIGFVLLERVTGRHLLKHFVVRLLAGDTLESLNISASSYASEALLNRRVMSVGDILNEYQSRNTRVLLASASLEPIVKSLADIIGADFVASRLEVVNGILTGRYLIDLTGCKDAEIERKYRGCLVDGEFTMISDNITDQELMQRARVAFVVLHKKSHSARWSGTKATFLEFN